MSKLSDKARTVSERAVRKASRERLLKDMADAAWTIDVYRQFFRGDVMTLQTAEGCNSRTRYACLMTAFGG